MLRKGEPVFSGPENAKRSVLNTNTHELSRCACVCACVYTRACVSITKKRGHEFEGDI